MPVVIGLAVLAAFLFAAAATLQQRAAFRRAPTSIGRAAAWPRSGGPAARWRGWATAARSVLAPLVGLIGDLLRSPLWLLGWLTNLAGFLVQAAALHLGSVALVQPLLVTQLLFALAMTAVVTRRRPGVRAWMAGAAICAGLAIFLSVRGLAVLAGQPDPVRVVLAAVSAVAVAAALVVASAGRPPLPHATLLAVAAGLWFAVSAVLMKLTAADLVDRGVAATAADWPGYALVASTITGLVLEQGAFATGSLPAAVAAMTITNPLASYAIGVLAFDARVPAGAGELTALAAAAVLLIAGVLGLANAPVTRRADPVGGSGSGRRCAKRSR